MSGLVNGLQNRLQQFESARHLKLNTQYTEMKNDFYLVF